MTVSSAPGNRTHEVFNQAPPLAPYNVFEADRALRDATEREGAGWGADRLAAAGARAGSVEAIADSERCERNEPILRTHDRYGNRQDHVELDPSWHRLLGEAIERECHGLPWRDPSPGAHVLRAGLFMVWSQVNAGVMCPVSMTHAVIPALRESPELAQKWESRLTAPVYGEGGALAGMAMTEKQGGSDVRANTTRAVPAGGDEWEITGHKWFCSYPPCDVFLTLAQTDEGLSCFLIEGPEREGGQPGFRIQRLKDKLGTRSLPSSEVEFHAVPGRLVGEEGRGVQTIIQMVNHTRLDCLLGSAASIRWGTAHAVHHARHRSAFGKPLADQPAMRNVLADLQLESEAATAGALRIARAFDEADAPFRRFGTAVMKYWTCKRAPQHALEALECLGGNGYVEESGMPRLLRDSPLNSIWEGSGNIAALDVLRAFVKEPEGFPAFLAEVETGTGSDTRLDAHVSRVKDQVAGLAKDGADPQWQARSLVEDLGLALQGSLLVRHAPPAVADGFCAARLDGRSGHTFGTLPDGIDVDAILARALPA